MKTRYKKQYEQFGLNVVFYRKRKRLTQFQLAELVDDADQLFYKDFDRDKLYEYAAKGLMAA